MPTAAELKKRKPLQKRKMDQPCSNRPCDQFAVTKGLCKRCYD